MAIFANQTLQKPQILFLNFAENFAEQVANLLIYNT